MSNLTWNSTFTPFWNCPHHHSSPTQARTPKFGPEVQSTLVKWGGTLTFKVIFGSKSQIFRFQHYWKYITTTQPPESHEYLDCFASQAWLFHSLHPVHVLIHLDCFMVPTVSHDCLNMLQVYWSRHPRVFRRLTSLLLKQKSLSSKV